MISLTIYFLTLNKLNNDAFSIISLTMFGNLLADTYSPNILFMQEKNFHYRSSDIADANFSSIFPDSLVVEVQLSSLDYNP